MIQFSFRVVLFTRGLDSEKVCVGDCNLYLNKSRAVSIYSVESGKIIFTIRLGNLKIDKLANHMIRVGNIFLKPKSIKDLNELYNALIK